MKHKNCFTRVVFTLTALTAWLSAWAADVGGGRWLFHTVDVRDGLADNFVRDIMTDSEGYVWLSTINGLSRYDGYRFLNFYPQQWGGRSGDVTMVRQTADGTLWMVCSGELLTYCRDAQTWQKDGTERLHEMGMEGSRVNRLHVDDEGGLWVATEQGLYHHDYQQARLSHIDCRGLAPILHILTKNGITLVVTADYRIYKVTANGKSKLLTRHPNPGAESRDNRAMIDSRMNLWLYHAHDQVGSLWIYQIGSGEWQQPSALAGIDREATVNAIAEDNDGRLWVGTGNGIYSEKGMESSLRHVTCLYTDRNNTIWVGSAKLGASYADLNSPEFDHVSIDGREDVSALMEDGQGNLWIGFDGGGVVRRGDGYLEDVAFSASSGQLPSDHVTALATDGQGNTLVGTYGGGIALFDGKRFCPLYPDYDRLQYVKAMVTDRHGALWVATVDKGVVRITEEKRFTNYTTANSPLNSDGILCLAYDAPSDRIYIGTSIGLAAYDCSRGSFISDEALNSLGSVSVTALMVDANGRLWIGSRDGLWVWGKRLQHLTTEQGLSHNVVRALAASDENVWASTDNGLTCLSMEQDTLKCRPFFDSDGLHGMIFTNNAALTTAEGTVLLGSQTGYVTIPHSPLTTRHSPLTPPLTVRFTEFRINGNPVVLPLQGFTIDYGERLGFSISIMVPALSHKARYLYRFKGDKEWMRAPNNMFYFASLMPGTHVLQVKAELPGMATTDVNELTFRVRPPFWLSRWAIIGYVLMLAAVIGLIWRAIILRQHREMAMKQMEINLKKYEMEEQKISFFTNISHDIKTPLTMVMAPLEKIRDASLPAAVRTEIDVAWQNARQLYDLVLELLDFRRLDEGKEMLNLSQGELVSFVRRLAQGFDYIAKRRNIAMELRLPTNAIETAFDKNKLRRIVINLLSNAFKYNVEGGSVTVILTQGDKQRDTAASSDNGASSTIQLSIADTGIGIKDKRHIFDRFVQETHGQEQEGSGLGLHIVREYVDIMGGTISVADNHPQGTVFTVTLPVHQPTSNTQHPTSTTQHPTPNTQHLTLTTHHPTPTTVLIVEDNVDARLFLQRNLEDEYRVLMAANGRDALTLLAKESISIVVSDVMMPVMDGMELVRQMRNNIRFSHIPIILLTAKSGEEDVVSGLKEGVADYLTKPYSLAVLRLRIKKILEWTQHIHQQVATGIDIKPSEITVSSLDEELISHVLAEVEEHMTDPTYSVVQLSSAIGMTRGTLYKKLMAIVGKSPVEFIRIVRLKRGKALLDQGRTNVSEVADKVGFSPKMFAQYFREMYGDTPSDYLKRQKSRNN